MKKFLFTLEILYPEKSMRVNREFSAKTRKQAFGLARKWMNNCLAICGKDERGRQYISAEISCPA